MAQKDILGRLADAGEEAIQRLAGAPGADQVMGFATSMRDRMDELQRRVRGLDAMEQRITDLERQVRELSGGAPVGGSTGGADDSTADAVSSTIEPAPSGSAAGVVDPMSDPMGGSTAVEDDALAAPLGASIVGDDPVDAPLGASMLGSDPLGAPPAGATVGGDALDAPLGAATADDLDPLDEPVGATFTPTDVDSGASEASGGVERPESPASSEPRAEDS